MSRLEEIRFIIEGVNRLSHDEDYNSVLVSLEKLYREGHLQHLIQQAELVEELEEHKELALEMAQAYEHTKKLYQRYKQALEKIRDTHFSDTNTTAHDIAKEALER